MNVTYLVPEEKMVFQEKNVMLSFACKTCPLLNAKCAYHLNTLQLIVVFSPSPCHSSFKTASFSLIPLKITLKQLNYQILVRRFLKQDRKLSQGKNEIAGCHVKTSQFPVGSHSVVLRRLLDSCLGKMSL